MCFKGFVEKKETGEAQSQNVYRQWKAADFDGISRYLYVVDWSRFFSERFTADSIWSAFSQVLNDAIETFAPSIPVQVHK